MHEPISPRTFSSFLQLAAKAKEEARRKRRPQRNCCNVCKEEYLNDLQYPDLLRYDRGIPESKAVIEGFGKISLLESQTDLRHFAKPKKPKYAPAFNVAAFMRAKKLMERKRRAEKPPSKYLDGLPPCCKFCPSGCQGAARSGGGRPSGQSGGKTHKKSASKGTKKQGGKSQSNKQNTPKSPSKQTKGKFKKSRFRSSSHSSTLSASSQPTNTNDDNKQEDPLTVSDEALLETESEIGASAQTEAAERAEDTASADSSKGFFDKVKSGVGKLANAVKSFFSRAKNAVKGAAAKVKSAASNVASKIKGGASNVFGKAANMFSKLRSGVADLTKRVVAAAKKVVKQIKQKVQVDIPPIEIPKKQDVRAYEDKHNPSKAHDPLGSESDYDRCAGRAGCCNMCYADWPTPENRTPHRQKLVAEREKKRLEKKEKRAKTQKAKQRIQAEKQAAVMKYGPPKKPAAPNQPPKPKPAPSPPYLQQPQVLLHGEQNVQGKQPTPIT